MFKKLVAFGFAMATLLSVAEFVYTETVEPSAGYAGAPGDNGTCGDVACHDVVPTVNSQFLTFELFQDTATKYQTSTSYAFLINNSNFGQSVYGFQVTALDVNGNQAGNFTLISPNSTSLTTQAGRQYVGHKNANGTVAWLFNWESPATCVGDVTFYVAAVAANGNGLATGDEVYTYEFLFPPLISCSNLTADFTLSDNDVCIGESVTFTDASSGGGVTTWAWDFGAGATPANTTGQGPHSVTYSTMGVKTASLLISDGNDTDTITKTLNVSSLPVAVTIGDTSICFGDSLKLSASGGVSYLWSPTGDLSDPAIVNPVASPTVTTVYSVTVTDANGCTATDNLTLTVDPLPNSSVQDGIVCSGGTLTLDAGAGFQTYSWSTTDITQTTDVTTAGTYYVTVEDVNGCFGVDSAIVTLGSNLLVTLPDTTICQGETLILDAGNTGSTYLWSTGDTTQTITVDVSGTYFVDVSSGACIGADTSEVIVKATTQANAGGDTAICVGDAVILGGPSLPAQIILNEDFNACSLPTGWATFNALGTEVFQFGAVGHGTVSVNGSCMAFFDDDGTNTAGDTVNDVFLVTPPFDGTPYNSISFEADIDYQNFDNIDTFIIDVWDGLQWVNILEWNEDHSTFDVQDFERVTLDLTPYINSAMQVRFNFDDGRDWAWYVHIDNVVVTGVPNPVFSVLWTPPIGLDDATVLNPIATPTATTEYQVTYADTNGCSTVDTVLVTVNPLPTVNFVGLGGPYCEDDNSNVLLSGSPAGGYFSGPGITLNGGNAASRLYSSGPDSIPDDNVLGISVPFPVSGLSGNALGRNIILESICFEVSHTWVGDLYIELVSPNGTTITLVDRPGVGFFSPGCEENNMQVCIELGVGNDLDDECTSGAPFAIFGNYTAHGGQNLNDVNDGTTDPNGTWTLFLSDGGTGDIGRLEEFQLNFRVGGTPVFNPSRSGPGIHDINYTFTNGNGCTNTATKQVQVNSLPAVDIIGLDFTYCIDEDADSIEVFPVGGDLVGQGIVGSFFDPAAAGVGEHEIFYTYVDTIGCTDTIFQTVTVLPATVTSFTGLGGPYCSIDNVEDTLVGSPSGGVFSGPGVVGNIFNPSQAGAGLHNIVYTYTPTAKYEVDTTCVYGPIAGTLTGIVLPESDEAVSGAIPIGFSFGFFGINYNYVQVSSNGFITFDTTNTNSDSSNDAIPSSNGVENLIAGMWDNLVTDSVGYFVDGVGPNRRFVVHFIDAYQFNVPSEVVNFQIILHEGSNIIEIQCIECQKDASSASGTQGIENIDGSVGIAPDGRNNTTWDAFNDCVRFIPTLCPGEVVQQVLVTGINLGPDVRLCIGDTIELTASGGVAPFTWSTGDTTLSIKVNPTDTTQYFVSSIDSASCAATDTVTVYVVQPTPLSISNLDRSYCNNELPFTLVGVPSGGTFSGTGVSNNVFDPINTPPGGPYIITYEGLDTNGCVSSITAQTQVFTAPTASFTGLDSQYCEDVPDVTLTGAPLGGVFGGAGISNNTFVPFFAGPGTHIITYGIVDPNNGCVGVDSFEVTVDALPVVSFTGLDTAYCENASVDVLIGSPIGGVFSGTGISSTLFSPATAGVGGPYVIEYSYMDTNGCSNIYEELTYVRPLPDLSFVGLKSSYCVNAASFSLRAIPAGGTFFGTGVSSGSFDPGSAGAGTHDISYTLTNAFGCADTITRSVIVFAEPTVVFTGLDATYCQNNPLSFLTGSPSGGTFSGVGTAGTTFSPTLAGTGTWDITYTYTDSDGCTGTDVQSTTVNNVPTPSISGLDVKYCPLDAAVAVTVTPTGGTLSGAGVSGTDFNPANSGYGIHGIIYTVTSNEGCTGTARVDVLVDYCPGVEIIGGLEDINLYPNPTSGWVNIEITGTLNGDTQLELFDIQGKQLFSRAIGQVGSSVGIQLDLGSYATGMYYVRISNTDMQIVKKVVVE